MADEREDERYEEGEYHFSEDQVNYETDHPEQKGIPAEGGKAASFLSKLTPARRAIIGTIIFIVLLSIVFKMLLPTGAPPTEFTQAETQKPLVAKTTPPPPEKLNNQPANPTIAKTESPQQPNTPAMQALPTQAASLSTQLQPNLQQESAPPMATQAPPPSVGMNAPPMQPPQSMAEGVPQSNTPVASSNMQPVVVMQNTQPEPVSNGAPQAGSVTAGPPPTQNVVERLASLEQENAANMSMLRTDYVQKLSDFETQNTETRNRIDELTKKIHHLEATINQLSQMLQNVNKAPMATGLIEQATISRPQPKQIFTVQAIIPGRAWLKSDAGETVTVAEGDLLRNYGRITKIDPYDGIVNIDTGNKVVTLSYGMSAE